VSSILLNLYINKFNETGSYASVCLQLVLTEHMWWGKNTFNFRWIGLSFKIDHPILLFFRVISSHCWVRWLRKIDYLNCTLSLEVALRARWILYNLVMEIFPEGIRIFFQSGLSAMIKNSENISSTMLSKKMWTIWHREMIIHICHKLMWFQPFSKSCIHQMML
jgi:hypothetical protein